MSKEDATYSEAETKRRMEDAIRRAQKTPHKPQAPKGKASRAQSTKGSKVQPAKQPIKRQRGR